MAVWPNIVKRYGHETVWSIHWCKPVSGGGIWRMHSASQGCICFVSIWSHVAPGVYMVYGERARSANTYRCEYRFVRKSHYTVRSHKNRCEANELVTGGSGAMKDKLVQLISGDAAINNADGKIKLLNQFHLIFGFVYTTTGTSK